MDDAAIIASRERLREERKRLFDEDDRLLVELKAIPLTTAEQEAQEALKQQEAENEERDRLAGEIQDRRFIGLLVCFGTLIVIGLVLYLVGGIVAVYGDSACGMLGPLRSFLYEKPYPAQCGNGFFTAGIVVFIIGISPIVIACMIGAAM